jgi:hypothetical protein
MHDQIASFYKIPGLMRLGFMDVGHSPYCHMDRVAAAVEKAILTEEARTLGLVMKDVRLMQRRVAKAEAEAGQGIKIDPNMLSDDDNGDKGSGILLIGQVSASRVWNNCSRRLD